MLVGIILHLSSGNDDIVFFDFLWYIMNNLFYFNVVSCCNLRNCILRTSVNIPVYHFQYAKSIEHPLFLHVCIKKDAYFRTLPKIVDRWIMNYPLKERFIENIWQNPKAATGGVLWKKLFLKISQYSKESTWVGVSFLKKVQVFRAATLLKNNSITGI